MTYIAVGYFLAQEDEKDPKKKNYLHFGSITLLSPGKSEARRESSGAPEPGRKSWKH